MGAFEAFPKWDRIAAMNHAKDCKPASGGKVYAMPKRRHHTPAPGSWDRLLTDTKARWHNVAGDAINQYCWDVNPSRDDIERFIADGGTL